MRFTKALLLAGCGIAASSCAAILGFDDTTVRDRGGGDRGADAGDDPRSGRDCPDKDVKIDPNNCGTCNHSCRGGTCTDGMCDPVRFAAVPVGPPGYATEIALDKGGVVVTVGTDTGGVYYVPFDADGGFSAIALSQAQPRGPSSNGVYVCWAAAGTSIVACNLRDGGAPLQGTVNVGGGPISTATLGTETYWVTHAVSDVRRIPLDGSTNTATIFATYQGNGFSGGRSLVADGNRLVWIIRDAKAIVAVTLDGTVPIEAMTLARTQIAFANAIAVGEDAYYVVAEDNGSDMGGLYRVPKDSTGGFALPLVRQSLITPSIAVDAKYAYYTDQNGGTVCRFPLGAPVPTGDAQPGANARSETIAKGQTNPTSIAVNEQFIFWINGGPNGGLMRVAK